MLYLFCYVVIERGQDDRFTLFYTLCFLPDYHSCRWSNTYTRSKCGNNLLSNVPASKCRVRMFTCMCILHKTHVEVFFLAETCTKIDPSYKLLGSYCWLDKDTSKLLLCPLRSHKLCISRISIPWSLRTALDMVLATIAVSMCTTRAQKSILLYLTAIRGERKEAQPWWVTTMKKNQCVSYVSFSVLLLIVNQLVIHHPEKKNTNDTIAQHTWFTSESVCVLFRGKKQHLQNLPKIHFTLFNKRCKGLVNAVCNRCWIFNVKF